MVKEQHVDGARLVHRPLNRVVVTHVGGEHSHVDAGGKADGGFGLLELLGGAGEDGDAGALGGGAVGEGEADAAGSAGDEHVAVLDRDLDRAGPDQEVEEAEEEEGKENEEGEVRVRH